MLDTLDDTEIARCGDMLARMIEALRVHDECLEHARRS
jgi:hypothetical protein